MSGRFVLGDCLDALADQPAGSAQLVYVDPPFGTGAAKRGRAGRYADPLASITAYLDFLLPRLDVMIRLLDAQGSLFVHLDYRTVHHVKVALDRRLGPDRLVNELVWCYAVGGKGPHAFGRKHDTILWYAAGPRWRFYPDDVRIARRAGSHMKVTTDDDGRAVQVKTDRKTGRVYRYPVHAGKVPEDWWTDIETLNRGDRERTGWPTQKPERLLERILRATTQPGDLVVDGFCGSGTTPAVAERLGRRWLAVDRSKDALAIARGRVSARVAAG